LQISGLKKCRLRRSRLYEIIASVGRGGQSIMMWVILFGFYFALEILDPTKTQLDRMSMGILIAAVTSFTFFVAFRKTSSRMQVLPYTAGFVGVLITRYLGLIYSVLWFVLVFGLIAGFLGWQRHSQSLSSKQKP
jgi:hypothetical protein